MGVLARAYASFVCFLLAQQTTPHITLKWERSAFALIARHLSAHRYIIWCFYQNIASQIVISNKIRTKWDCEPNHFDIDAERQKKAIIIVIRCTLSLAFPRCRLQMRQFKCTCTCCKRIWIFPMPFLFRPFHSTGLLTFKRTHSTAHIFRGN